MESRIVRSAWSGQAPLWKAFWLYFVLGLHIGITVVAYVVGLEGLPYLAAWIVIAPVAVWASVSVWRCASNARWRGWGYIARTAVVVQMLGVGIHLVAGERPQSRYSDWQPPTRAYVPVR